MAKSKEELNALKQEVESINLKLKQLNEEELKYVSGGNDAVTNEFWLDIKESNDDPAWADWKSPDQPEPIYYGKK